MLQFFLQRRTLLDLGPQLVWASIIRHQQQLNSNSFYGQFPSHDFNCFKVVNSFQTVFLKFQWSGSSYSNSFNGQFPSHFSQPSQSFHILYLIESLEFGNYTPCKVQRGEKQSFLTWIQARISGFMQCTPSLADWPPLKCSICHTRFLSVWRFRFVPKLCFHAICTLSN